MTKKKETLRHMINVSPKELRELANEMETDYKETLKSLGYEDHYDNSKRGLLWIINKEPQCMDTWEFEK